MESDLLVREDKFYRENEKLERRKKDLMKKVTDVMKIQDNLIRDSLTIKMAKQNNDGLTKDIFESNKDDVGVPTVIEEIGGKGTNHFYRAKIKALQLENIRLQSENKKKTGELTKTQKENQILSNEKEKWLISNNTLKNDIGKLESQVSSFSSKLQSKDSEITALKKEIENLKKELKNSHLTANNLEVRLNRAYEETEKWKISLKNTKDGEKDIKDSFRKQISDLSSTVKVMEKHNLELLNGFKKQMLLINNLKKQKVCLETLKMAHYEETEYLKILDWKLQ